MRRSKRKVEGSPDSGRSVRTRGYGDRVSYHPPFAGGYWDEETGFFVESPGNFFFADDRPAMVRDPETGGLVPWSLEWQVNDDMAFRLRREVERFLPDPP